MNYKNYNFENLQKGKRYLWSGHSESLYTSYTWKNHLCKITSISEKSIRIYDYLDKRSYEYAIRDMEQTSAKFIKPFYTNLMLLPVLIAVLIIHY